MKLKAMSIGLAIVVAAPLAWGDASVDEYRAMLADKDANPGSLVIERGENLFKNPGGPQNATWKSATLAWAQANSRAHLPRCRVTSRIPAGYRMWNLV